jgi:magnesium transporter
MLDEDELPRIESAEDATLIVIDVPASIDNGKKHITYPLGVIISENHYVVTISPKSTKILNDFKKNLVKDFRTAKKTRFLIQIIINAAAGYLKVLKGIYSDIENKEKVLQQSTQNEDLIDLLSTEKTLVYFATSLKENDLVLERLSKGIVLPLYEGDLDLLEDALIENRQAIDMAGIYQNILNSITETYATIVSNNLNNVMKFLAGATIVLSIPTIISSFLGMNVQFGIIGTSDLSAIAILIFSVVASLLVAFWLKKKGML